MSHSISTDHASKQCCISMLQSHTCYLHPNNAVSVPFNHTLTISIQTIKSYRCSILPTSTHISANVEGPHAEKSHFMFTWYYLNVMNCSCLMFTWYYLNKINCPCLMFTWYYLNVINCPCLMFSWYYLNVINCSCLVDWLWMLDRHSQAFSSLPLAWDCWKQHGKSQKCQIICTIYF
jgi:hypothetical protein